MRTIYLLLIFVLSLPQISCAGSVEEKVGGYQPVEVTPQLRQGLERMKREFLQLEAPLRPMLASKAAYSSIIACMSVARCPRSRKGLSWD